MKNDKVWDKIDASPLLQLPPEQRKALHEAGMNSSAPFGAIALPLR